MGEKQRPRRMMFPSHFSRDLFPPPESAPRDKHGQLRTGCSDCCAFPVVPQLLRSPESSKTTDGRHPLVDGNHESGIFQSSRENTRPALTYPWRFATPEGQSLPPHPAWHCCLQTPSHAPQDLKARMKLQGVNSRENIISASLPSSCSASHS